jgi:hypothetical protein
MLFRLLKVLLSPLFVFALFEALFLIFIFYLISPIKYIITGSFFTDEELDKFINKFPIVTFIYWLYFSKK